MLALHIVDWTCSLSAVGGHQLTRSRLDRWQWEIIENPSWEERSFANFDLHCQVGRILLSSITFLWDSIPSLIYTAHNEQNGTSGSWPWLSLAPFSWRQEAWTWLNWSQHVIYRPGFSECQYRFSNMSIAGLCVHCAYGYRCRANIKIVSRKWWLKHDAISILYDCQTDTRQILDGTNLKSPSTDIHTPIHACCFSFRWDFFVSYGFFTVTSIVVLVVHVSFLRMGFIQHMPDYSGYYEALTPRMVRVWCVASSLSRSCKWLTISWSSHDWLGMFSWRSKGCSWSLWEVWVVDWSCGSRGGSIVTVNDGDLLTTLANILWCQGSVITSILLDCFQTSACLLSSNVSDLSSLLAHNLVCMLELGVDKFFVLSVDKWDQEDDTCCE